MRRSRYNRPVVGRIKTKRRRFIPMLKKLALWNGAMALTAGVALALYNNLFQKAAHESWNGVVTSTGFLGWNSQNLIIEGRKTLSEKDIKDAIEFKVNEPLLSVDIDSIYRRLKKTPWIKNVCVKKIYPQTLYIKIEERKPYCCVLQKNRNVVVDHEGVVLLEGLEHHLPKVKGFDAHLHAHEILDILANFPKIMTQVDYIERRRSGRFDLFLKDGKRIALPRLHFLPAIVKCNEIIESGMIKPAYAVIDLRVPDKIIYTGKQNDMENGKDSISLLIKPII